MATFKIDKVLSALPETLVADTVYAVRVGVGFDLYIVDSTGSIAYKINAPVNAIAKNVQTGTTYTLVSGDAWGEVQGDNASAITHTIDPSVLSPEDRGLIRQIGAGQITVVLSTGTPILGGPTAKTAQKGSALSWYYDGTDVYINGECAAS